MKFKPPQLPTNPTPEQWRWWKRIFIDGLAINEVVENTHKLTFLRSHAGSELYPLLQNAETFDAAMDILDAQFEKPTRVIFARHELLSCRQKEGERIPDFIKRLKILVELCECKPLTAYVHKQLLLRDALVSGLRSDHVRARLLELDDTKSVDDCIALANAVELSTDYSRSFRAETSEQSNSVSAVQP